MRAPSPPDPRQLALFIECLELVWIPDKPTDFDDGSFGLLTGRPEGRGWRALPIAKQRERSTGWMRRNPVVRAPCKATRGGGGWRR